MQVYEAMKAGSVDIWLIFFQHHFRREVGEILACSSLNIISVERQSIYTQQWVIAEIKELVFSSIQQV